MEIMLIPVIMITLKKLKERRTNKIMRAEIEKQKWIAEVNRTAIQPTLKPKEDKEKIEKLKRFLALNRKVVK